ncbi:MAG TPA: HesA/MoeB/ThiF family protein [Alphaproteobacteria bacterium]|nr:HesA/MoeB/ThiF family protein [Alphaproteobacteria bacterium]
MADCSLSADEQSRYARHMQLDEIGETGQLKLKSARVLIVGLGGLGCPAALYLSAAGVGTIGLLDADRVSLSNLQRQVIYQTADVGELKVEIAARRLREMNPHVNLQLHLVMLLAENALNIFADYDIIFDGTDNFAAHYLINDAAVLAGKKLVWGSVEKFAGQVGVVLPRETACYRCIYPSPPPAGVAPSCSDIGVLGAMPGLIGMMQAVEVLKLILGLGYPAEVMRVDAMTMQFKTIRMVRDQKCALCGTAPGITKPEDMHAVCSVIPEITVEELRNKNIFLLDVRNEDEFASGALENAKLIPLPVLQLRISELSPDQEMIVYCHAGKRSLQACEILQKHGFHKIKTLKGGILAAREAGLCA